MFLHKIYRLFCLPVMFFNFIVLCVLRSEPSIIHFPTLTLNSLGVHTKDHLISKFKLFIYLLFYILLICSIHLIYCGNDTLPWEGVDVGHIISHVEKEFTKYSRIFFPRVSLASSLVIYVLFLSAFLLCCDLPKGYQPDGPTRADVLQLIFSTSAIVG